MPMTILSPDQGYDDNEDLKDLDILELLEENPNSTQAVLANKLGVAVGTINWHVKHLVDKGYLKIQRLERRKLKYIITPQGLALRTRLAVDYIHSSFQLYRLLRQRMKSVLDQCSEAHYSALILNGDGDVAEICRLTGIEQGFKIIDQKTAAQKEMKLPVVDIQGLKLFLTIPDDSK